MARAVTAKVKKESKRHVGVAFLNCLPNICKVQAVLPAERQDGFRRGAESHKY
jgi:hypothetical protein